MDPEYKIKLSDAAKGYWQNQEFIKKMHDSQIISQNRPETKKRKSDIMSIVRKGEWKDPEFAKKMARSWGRKPNNPEKVFEKWLNDNYPGEWKYVGNGSVWFDRCNPDFININGKKKVIEIYGCYWHACEDCGFGNITLPNGLTADQVHNMDKNKRETYSKYGFDTLCLWEHDLNNKTYCIGI